MAIYQPFSNGTEFMAWTEENCDRCVKASSTDKFRCAIQRDIILASIGDGTTSKRVHDICQKRDCKFRQEARKQYTKKVIDNEPKIF